MTSFSVDFSPETDRQRKDALIWFRRQARECLQILNTTSDPQFRDQIVKKFEGYQQAVKRLSEMDI